MGYLRRAGRGGLDDGRLVAWSVAEGMRGRRWRWTVLAAEGILEHAGLIELDASGRFARLELETAAGMLTLHPAGDGATAHGNVVRTDRVDPLHVIWKVDTAIRIEWDPFASGLLVGGAVTAIAIAADLTVSVRASIGDALAGPTLPDLDGRGIPRLGDAIEWPLEV